MEKKRKPFIVRLLGWLIGIFLVLALAVSAVIVYVNKKYDVNLVKTYGEVKLLSQKVDEDAKFKSKFTADDMAAAQVNINAKIADLITYTEEDGYKIGTPTSAISAELMISDKQIGALINTALTNGDATVGVDIGGEDITIELVQIAFDNVDNSTGDADFNVVVKLNISSLREKFNKFPMSMFKKYIPETLYVSSVTTIKKGETAFSYTIESKSLTINNLTEDQTADLFKTLNIVTQVGTAEDMNKTIGSNFANCLIGNEQNPDGLTYKLKENGVSDYTFKTDGTTNYYVMQVG